MDSKKNKKYGLTNIKQTYLYHPGSKFDSIRLCVAQKPDEHAQIQRRKRHLAYTFTIKRPALSSAIRPHESICVAYNPASLAASPDSTDPPPLTPAEFQRTCGPPPEEELLVGSCFHEGGGEVVK